MSFYLSELMQKRFVKQNSSSGFTLLENLVVFIIIGILAAIALPNWLAFVDVQRLNTAQDEVYQAMRQAQREAIKQKLSWQVSFRQQHDIVQWSVHQAEAGIFISDAVNNSDRLWNKLDRNIRIDQQQNKKGKSETTIRKQSSQQAWRVVFNYQGCPIYEVGNECFNTSLQALGQINLYSTNGGQARRCVYVSTILGAMRRGKDHTQANENDKFCY